MRNLKKLTLTLVALFAMTAGAWATTYTELKDGDVLKVGDILNVPENQQWEINGYSFISNWSPYTVVRANITGTLPDVTVTEAADGAYYLIKYNNGNGNGYSFLAPEEYRLPVTAMPDGLHVKQIGHMMYTFTAAPAGTALTPDATRKVWTLDKMPAGNVTLEPEYYPQAEFAMSTGTEPYALFPEPIDAIFFATTDQPLVSPGRVADIPGSTDGKKQGTVMFYVSKTNNLTEDQLIALVNEGKWSSDVPTAADINEACEVYVYYYIKGNDGDTDETTFSDGDFCSYPFHFTIAAAPTYAVTFKAANANTIEAGKATVTVGGTAATLTDGKLQGVKMGSKVTITAKEGYKFRKVEVKKGGGEPVLLTTITAADNSSFKSGSQTFGDVATVTLTGDYLTNDGSHGGWYCLGSNKTATISVAEANGANITSVKFYTAGGGSAEDKDAPFEVTTTSVTSSNITTYLNGNSIGSYGVSKIEVYGTK